MKHLFTFLIYLIVSSGLHLQAQTSPFADDMSLIKKANIGGYSLKTARKTQSRVAITVSSARIAAATSTTFTYTGQIVNYTVPTGVTSLTIEARGAEGGNNPGSAYRPGKGAIIIGTVSVVPGQQLKILVGQQPTDGINSGGGGSFVTGNANNPLVIAGGGGGSGNDSDSNNKHGQAGQNGGNGAGDGATGGTGGNGGGVSRGPSGGGLLTDGSTGTAGYTNGGGKAFVNGGSGGSAGINNDQEVGGFGGGGAGTGNVSGAGGGGYSGGGGGGNGGVGGGGGSYNSGTDPISKTGATDGNSGDGVVIISYTPPCTDFTATLMPSGQLTCTNKTITLTARGGLDGATYQYSAGATNNGATATVTNDGPYSVTVTNPGGCSSTATTTVSSNTAAPTASLSNNGPITCANRTVSLSAGGGNTYSFSSGATATGPTTATVANDGLYSVTVTGTNGCTATQTTQVASNTTAPNATLNNSGPITCTNRTVTLTAGGGGSYAFSAGTTVNGNQATVTNEGTYTVTVTSTTNGCSSFTTTTVSSNTTNPTATLTNNGPITANRPTVTLTAGGGNTYQFSPGAAQQGGGNTATVTTPGQYQVTVTSAGNGCSAIASTTVTGAVSGSSCRNGSGVINVVASGTPVKYEWYRNSITSARLTENPAQVRGTSTASLTLVNQQATADYYVRVTDANGSAVVYGPFRFTVNTGCNIYARQGAEEVELRISLLGNPVQGNQLKAVIRGAEGKVLNVQLLDLSGRPVRAEQWQQAISEHTVEWNLSSQGSGIYLLQATTSDQRQSVKVIKQ